MVGMEETDMRTLCLRLTTNRGEELCRLPLPDVQIASVGEAAAQTEGSWPGELQVLDLYTRIENAVLAEGVELAMESLDFQIGVSKALLGVGGDTSQDGFLIVTLPVT